MININFNKSNKGSYSIQIYNLIKDKILNNTIKAYEKLPSSRELASELKVSRNTISVAYDMLIAEGYVKSVPGSGVYVEKQVKLIKPTKKISSSSSTTTEDIIIDDTFINFDSGLPALELFSKTKWNKYISKAFNEIPLSVLGYDYPQGRPELRATLVSYLKKSKGINCDLDQIIITSGAKQGITLIAKCLLDKNDIVLIEDPTNSNVRKIFSYHTNKIVPISVDTEGIIVNNLPKDVNPKAIFVTPSHQFPMGGILSIQRKIELINYAIEKNSYIIEDDYDSEFNYNYQVTNSLLELNNDKIIHIGTFSKTMFPSIRLGYLIVPKKLVKDLIELKRLSDHHSNPINQLALMHYIEDSCFERHLSKMKKIYSKRRNYLIDTLHKYFDNIKIYGNSSGMHVVVEFENIDFTFDLMNKLREAKINLVPISKHSYFPEKYKSMIILGYASLNEERIEKGIRYLKQILTSEITV